MRMGIDLGGTKIEAIAMDDAGQERGRLRVPTPKHDYPGTLEAIAGLLERLEATAGRVRTVGLGIPGAVSPASGLVKNANSTWLIGHPLDRDLGQRLGRPVRVANDANCFALSEAVDGAGAQPAAGARQPAYPHVVFGVIVGTGTGGGVVVDRKILVGPNSIAGEWGHNPLPWMTPRRVPGPALLLRQAGLHRDLPVGPGPGARPPARDRAGAGRRRRWWRRRDAGDSAAEATIVRYEDRMARALASVLNVLDPTWWCWAAACPRSRGSIRTSPGCGANTRSRTRC